MRSMFNHSRNCTLMTLAAGAASLAAASAQGAFITDRSFFNPHPTSIINFEVDGNGQAVNLIQGQTRIMPATEYATLGITLTGNGSSVYWVNDGNAAFDLAQTLGGAGGNSIPSSLNSSFTMTFNVVVRAFAFFVANNRGVDSSGPVFVARDAGGNIIDTATFSPIFVDGTVNHPTTTADYGFMGIWSTTPIASVTVTKQAAILDDLHYSPIPTPGVTALAGMGALIVGTRRRRN